MQTGISDLINLVDDESETVGTGLLHGSPFNDDPLEETWPLREESPRNADCIDSILHGIEPNK